MYHLRVPVTEQELKEYYQFRWEMLRKPLHQPVGSEKDAYDAMAHHQMVVDEAGKIVAIGRLYINADNEAAIRLYESEGFTRIGLRKRYYRVSGADAYSMKREPR